MKRRNLFKMALGGIVGAFTGVKAPVRASIPIPPLIPDATFNPVGFRGDLMWITQYPARYNVPDGERIYPKHIVDGMVVANPEYDTALFEEVFLFSENLGEVKGDVDGSMFETEIRPIRRIIQP